jgi:hypothetical protein
MFSRLCLLLALSTCAFADDLVWGGKWAGVWSNFGTSPYTAINTTQNNKVLVIFCLDYNDEIAAPYEWLANIRPLTPANVTNYAQFGGNYGLGITTTPWAFNGDPGVNGGGVDLSPSAAAYDRYREAAWLFTNIMDAQSHNDLNTMIASQVAAWDLFVEGINANDLKTRIAQTNNPNSLYTFNNYEYSTNNYATAPGISSISNLLFQDAVDEALKAAQKAVLTQNWYGSAFAPSWDLVTGDPTWSAQYGRPVQEFLTDGPPSVPEPASILLLCTTVAVMAIAMHRKMQRSRV